MSFVKSRFCLFAFGMLASLVIVGCSNRPTVSPTTAPNNPAQASSEEGMAMTTGLAELTEDDRAAAIDQAVCPVSGEKLGSMGAPPKLVVNGQEIFICCDGCEETLLADPDKYLAKLKSE